LSNDCERFVSGAARNNEPTKEEQRTKSTATAYLNSAAALAAGRGTSKVVAFICVHARVRLVARALLRTRRGAFYDAALVVHAAAALPLRRRAIGVGTTRGRHTHVLRVNRTALNTPVQLAALVESIATALTRLALAAQRAALVRVHARVVAVLTALLHFWRNVAALNCKNKTKTRMIE
jgi:hypothetical protein